jgi:type VI protein secretion system component VasA
VSDPHADSMQRPPRRLSITGDEREHAAVAELIRLCLSATADGVLSDDEIADLRAWLDDNASLAIPARDYLLSTVQHILDDGVITDNERTALFLAIELVLPPD